MRTAIVTGATSFTGHAVVQNLLNQNYAVLAIVRPDSKNREILQQHEHLQILNIDLGEIDKLADMPVKGDCFFHFGWDGVGSQGRSNASIQRRNVADSVACVKAASSVGCSRFIFAGSQAEYGICQDRITEKTPCRPVSEYGWAKLRVYDEASKLCERIGMQYAHARIFSIYGPGDHPWTLVESCVRKLSRGETVELGLCLHKWNYLYVDDAARAIVKIDEQKDVMPDDNGIINVASDDTRILKSFVEEIYELTERRGHLLFGARKQDDANTVWLDPDISKLMLLTDWKPYLPFKKGIQNVIEYNKTMDRGES